MFSSLQLNMNELDDRFVAMEQYCNRVQDLDNTTVSKEWVNQK